MNVDEYISSQEANYTDCLDLSKRKCSDYAGNDPFRNFRMAAAVIGRPVWEVMLSRIAEKVIRTGNLLAKRDRGEVAAVKDESVFDTLRDLIVYPNLLKVWLTEEAKVAGATAVIANGLSEMGKAEFLGEISDSTTRFHNFASHITGGTSPAIIHMGDCQCIICVLERKIKKENDK